MQAYLDLVRQVLDEGTRRPNRTGVDTLACFHLHLDVSMDDGFPLLTTKEVSWKNIVLENLWFLSGEPDIGLLKRHGCRFWDPWADPETLRVPSPYGNLWRAHPGPGGPRDQIRWVLEELKRNPASRRLVVSAWSPENAHGSALPPCHFVFVLHGTPEADGWRLDLHLTMRSCDIALGLPYNIAGYSLLLHLFASWAGMRPGRFGVTLVDGHIYTANADGSNAEYDHAPGLRKQLLRSPRPLPRLLLSETVREGLDSALSVLGGCTEEILSHFRIEGYDPHPGIRFRVAV